MSKLYSDGMGNFLHIGKCIEDENFIDLTIEEEKEDNSYDKVTLSLYKDYVIDLVAELQTLVGLDVQSKRSIAEYIVTVRYFPIVVGKDEVFKLKTHLSKEEVYHKILKEKEIENEWYDVSVLVETLDEYLEDIPTKQL